MPQRLNTLDEGHAIHHVDPPLAEMALLVPSGHLPI